MPKEVITIGTGEELAHRVWVIEYHKFIIYRWEPIWLLAWERKDMTNVFFFVENVPFRIRLKSMGKGIIQIIKAEINRIVGFSEER